MRQEPDYFGDQELDLIHIAKRLKDALRLEQLLTNGGIDYLIEPDRYSGGVIFRTERVGAFFYVAPDQSAAARELLTREGFRPYESENEANDRG